MTPVNRDREPLPGAPGGEALLPCPFCGEEQPPHDDTSWVRCIECGAESGWQSGGEAAIAAWNRRALIPRPAEPAQAAQDEGPQHRKLKTCKGCKHFVSEYWREPSGDGETYDSGTSADCTKAGRSISTYAGDEPAPPKWCPFLIAAAQEGRE